MNSYTVEKLAYGSVGADNVEPPIILIHGGASWRKTWDKVGKILADRTHRKVYALDMRNHGDSTWTDEFSFDIMVKDIGHFMDEHGLNKVVLIGHSMGGKIAVDFVLSQPHRVEKLIVEDFSPKPLSPEMSKLFDELINVFKQSLELIPLGTDYPTAQKIVKDHLAKHRLSSSAKRPDDGAPLPLEKKGARYAWKTQFEALQQLPIDYQWDESLEGLYLNPCLFIYGTQSFYNIAQDKELILKLFPNTKFYPIAGATHLVHTEYPEEFCEAVLHFLKSC